MSNVKLLCPRCGGYIPNNNEPGAFPGALSRLDSATEVCSACGVEEAMQQFAAQSADGATPMSEWPVDSARKVTA